MPKKPVARALNDFLEYMTGQPEGGSCLREKVRVYIPTCYSKCSTDAERARSKLTKLFKGSTTWEGRGAWIDKGRLYDEPIIVVESAHEHLCEKEAKVFVNIIQEYAKNAKQDSVSIENGFADFYIGKGARFKPEYVKYGKTKRER